MPSALGSEEEMLDRGLWEASLRVGTPLCSTPSEGKHYLSSSSSEEDYGQAEMV